MSEVAKSTTIPLFKTHFRDPPRPSASTALWAHLLRKDTVTSDTASMNSNAPSSNPPIVPLDKTGTSVRILLHDTQVNFEKFSARVDLLARGVEDAKREIVLVKTLFEEQNEKLSGEMIELVNRCQTEVQKSVASPAQAGKLDDLRKDLISTDRRLEGLDKRIDVIHMFNQTHSQALQSQTKALQTLQDQQGTIIAALMPLLPLLQAVPLHIESARNHITESFLKTSTALQDLISHPASNTMRSSTRRSSSAIPSDGLPPSSPLPRKRRRLDPEPIDLIKRPSAHSFTPHGDRPPLGSTHRYHFQHHLLEPQTHHPRPRTSHASPTRPRPQLQNFRSPLPTPIGITLTRRNASLAIPEPKTPRRPLGDLMPIQNFGTPSITQPCFRGPSQHLVDISGLNSSTRAQTPLLSGITPSTKRPPRLLRVHTSASDVADTSRAISQSANENLIRTPTIDNSSMSHTASYQNQAQSQAPKLSSLFPVVASIPAQTPVTHATSSSTFATTNPPTLVPLLSQSPKKILETLVSAPLSDLHNPQPPASRPTYSRQPSTHVEKLTHQDTKVAPKNPVPPLSRRTSFRKGGKRFIPLDDDDDDDDDDE